MTAGNTRRLHHRTVAAVGIALFLATGCSSDTDRSVPGSTTDSVVLQLTTTSPTTGGGAGDTTTSSSVPEAGGDETGVAATTRATLSVDEHPCASAAARIEGGYCHADGRRWADGGEGDWVEVEGPAPTTTVPDIRSGDQAGHEDGTPGLPDDEPEPASSPPTSEPERGPVTTMPPDDPAPTSTSLPSGPAPTDTATEDPDEDGTPVEDQPAEKEYLVTYAGGVFTPQRLDIPTGSVVTFVNQSEVPVWPASNIHPTHAILSSFDPLQTIPPRGSWSYRFERDGYWRYHNHVEPSEVGMVVTLGGGEQEVLPLLISMPELQFPVAPPSAAEEYNVNDDRELRDFIKLYGPAQALELLHEHELATGRSCHDQAHVSGRIAYEEFGPVAITVVVHECQAGVSHGAIEAFFAERGTIRLEEDINVICSYAPNPFTKHQCLHGIGHGLMAWTSYELHEALDLCDHAPEGYDQLSCQSGVFMENVVGGLSGVMGHSSEYIQADDPHFPCDIVQARYIDQCYFYQTSHMIYVFDSDFTKVAKACLEIPYSAQWHCFASFGRDVSAHHYQDPARSIETCNLAPEGDLRVVCLSGAVQDGFWDPSGASRALEFCAMLADNNTEQNGCYETIIPRAVDILTGPSEREAFCAALPEARQASCREKMG